MTEDADMPTPDAPEAVVEPVGLPEEAWVDLGGEA